jgi:hypothetical protein
MLSEHAILNAFEILEASGCKPPEAWAVKADGLARGLLSWRQVLADVTEAELERAIVAHLRSSPTPFWPMPGRLLHLARPPETDDADEAWGELGMKIRRFGAYNPPATAASDGTWTLDPDPVRRAAFEAGVAALGGWGQVCATLRTDDDNAAMRASFRAAYRSSRQRSAQAKEAATVSAILAGADLGKLLAGPDPEPVKRQPLQLAAEGGRVLSPEERAERMRAHERYMAERRAAIRQIGREAKDGGDA